MMSCKKFLAEYSQTDVTPKSTGDFAEILYSDGYPDSRTLLQPWMVFLDDDAESYNGPIIDNTKFMPGGGAIFQWQPDYIVRTAAAGNTTSLNSWGTYYHLLLGTNVVLQYLDNAIGTQEEKDLYKGEAYTLRAFYHFMLVNIYAKPYNDSTTTPDKSPGVPIRVSANLSDNFLSRNTVQEVYEQITKDLDNAIALLDKQKKNREVYRISHTAAHLLASRVYLYMEKWDKAIEHADKVLLYHPQLMDLNTWGGVPNPEEKPLVGQYNLETIWCYGRPEEQSDLPYAIAYEISHDLVKTFADNDLRKQIGIYETPEFMKEFLAADFGQAKYVGENSSAKMRLPNSWRSAEAYLNRAEAYIQQYRTKGNAGAAAQALNSLNTLRASRTDRASFTPWELKPADQLLQMCRDERRRELFREEAHRWFDLRRYGMPAIRHVYRPDRNSVQIFRLPARDPQYVMPIPDEVLTRNPVLVQNPLFSGTRLPE
ncbi:RagB/SusD family nutrient uptake outer membrane protein [Chitinophaga nivalis]|uniref:RagB/SusD family nutrient uptake outer membrane protein n=1 Tax=Chitinophaga nivalis TaxID=2991709 RepID=A0ABT3IH52_9BACT|nr:RagB/SusD family nutrient uptake outer membrane protein [Chitinophaga nivalis]MCW3467032.1 RagB/SusD family nutrient uptake outer membrane protein [Chitinophaga nivalis]MCW3483277.1 RagB/SusD family nutrient uptake outer membrane protein [Chitinophaga nivalis]